jgi:predicted metal-dependent peptidase
MTMNKMSRRRFEDLLQRTLKDEPFFTEFSSFVAKRPTSEKEMEYIKTACVRYTPTSSCFELIWNPYFFAELDENDPKYVVGVLKHEFYHLILGHLTNRNLAGSDASLQAVANYATDLAINSKLASEIPQNIVFHSLYDESVEDEDKEAAKFLIPGTPGPFKDYPIGEASEHYWHLIMKDKDLVKKIQAGATGRLVDFHDWANDPRDASYADQLLKKMLRESYNKCARSTEWGSISSETKRKIKEIFTPKINWRTTLRRFIQRSVRGERRSSIKKISRRAPYKYAGITADHVAKIAVSIDQSGSVDDELLAKFFAELSGLAKHVEFTVIPFDSKVREDKVFVWKKGQRIEPERVSCGGTNFEAPVEFVDRQRFDGHIILTDMMAPRPDSSRVQLMWCTDKRGLTDMDRFGFSQSGDYVVSIGD